MKNNVSKCKERKELGFQNEAKKRMSFLESYKYYILSENSTYLEYSSKKKGNIIIYHGKNSYEIGIELISPANHGIFRCGLSVLISLYNEEDIYKIYHLPSAYKKDDIKTYIKNQVDLLCEYGSPIFLGESYIWKLLEDKQNYILEKYWDNIEILQARELAKLAFDNKKYKDFIEILSPFISILKKSEILKLEYARKMIS